MDIKMCFVLGVNVIVASENKKTEEIQQQREREGNRTKIKNDRQTRTGRKEIIKHNRQHNRRQHNRRQHNRRERKGVAQGLASGEESPSVEWRACVRACVCVVGVGVGCCCAN